MNSRSQVELARRARLITEGKCVSCMAPREPETRSRCIECLRIMSEKNRSRYRLRKGIPIDAPLAPQGRPALY